MSLSGVSLGFLLLSMTPMTSHKWRNEWVVFEEVYLWLVEWVVFEEVYLWRVEWVVFEEVYWKPPF